MKIRLDKAMAQQRLVATRSQAESWIKLGRVFVDGVAVKKPGTMIDEAAAIRLHAREQYVSRAGLKLASVARTLKLDFRDAIVVDVGSSTGGFTEYALKAGAAKVFAVDVGTDQLHPSLRGEERIELHEKTDIRDFTPSETPTIVVMDVSFVSSRQLLPHIFSFCDTSTQLAIMIKPQFEARSSQIGKSGVIKNDTVRREILRDFEMWVKAHARVVMKADSEVKGAKGNAERFYLLQKLK